MLSDCKAHMFQNLHDTPSFHHVSTCFHRTDLTFRLVEPPEDWEHDFFNVVFQPLGGAWTLANARGRRGTTEEFNAADWLFCLLLNNITNLASCVSLQSRQCSPCSRF